MEGDESRLVRIDSAPVEVDAEATDEEIDARKKKALEEALDKARDATGESAPDLAKIERRGPFKADGAMYVSATVWIKPERERE